MKKILFAAVLLAGIFFNKTCFACDDCKKDDPAVNLRMAMNKLWEDHIIWTRNVIMCFTDDLPGTDQAVARLLKNQEDIGNAIKPVYGDEAGNKLTELLKSHITIAAEVLTAAKKGDDAGFTTANQKWQSNGDEIALFLSSANPDNWKSEEMKKMMSDHLQYTTEEAVARFKKDYDADIAAYEKAHNEILEMSEMLAIGIIKQFPEKFRTDKN